MVEIIYGVVNVATAFNLFLRQNKHYNNIGLQKSGFITKCVVGWVYMALYVKNK